MKIQEMRERQLQISSEARGILDAIGDEATPEEQREAESKFDNAMSEWDKLEARISREEKLGNAEERQRKAEQARIPGSQTDADSNPVADDDEERTQWSEDLAFRSFLAAGINALPQEARSLLRAGYNPAVNQASMDKLPKEIRTLVTGTGSAGGFTIPEGFSGELEKSMVAWGPMLDPGLTREMVTPSGNTIKWPTVDDTGNTGALHTEGGTVTDDNGADPTFAEKQLDAYVYDSEIVRVSVEMLNDSFFNLDSVLGGLLGERLGRIGNAQLTTGTGSSQPNGIVTAAGAGVTAVGAAAITFDEIIDLIHSIDPAYRASPGLRFMFQDGVLQALRKIKDGDGNYLWQQADARSGEPATIFGYPYAVNQAMDALATGNDTVVFGDFTKYVVRKVEGISVFRFGEKYMNELEIGFMAYNRIDGELINTNAVKKLTQA